MKKPDRFHRSPGACHHPGPGESLLHHHLIRATPIGDLAIAYRVSPFFIHRIFLPSPLAEQWNKWNPDNGGCRCECDEIIHLARKIRDYLQGDPASPGPVQWHQLYLKGLSTLQVQVLRSTCDIPYGRTASYKAIAEAIGRPRAYRFVGTALASNPFPIQIPCHRVIRSDASPGEYGGGGSLKQWLLHMESHNKKV